MSPISARRRKEEETANAIYLRLKAQMEPPPTAVEEVAMTPRTVVSSALTTPRPVVRGPQDAAARSVEPTLEPEEEARAEQVYQKHDKTGTGEVDMCEFEKMCQDLELPLDWAVANDWLDGQSEGTGLTLEDFKQLYARILMAQSPAVRKVANRKPVRLREIMGTESHMRQVYSKFARDKLSRRTPAMSIDDVCEALRFMGFPDVYGDNFDRFVDEWARLKGKGESVDYHEFVDCLNLLVDLCESYSSGVMPRSVQ